jgi:hypothetical protein
VGKHETGFARIERDFYPTPSWVVEALAEHVDLAGMHIWECACGTGEMSEALKAAGASVFSSDIEDRDYSGLDAVLDFVDGPHPDIRFNATITNPPFGKPTPYSPSDSSKPVCGGSPTSASWRCCYRKILMQEKRGRTSLPAARTTPARSS